MLSVQGEASEAEARKVQGEASEAEACDQFKARPARLWRAECNARRGQRDWGV